MMATNGPVGKPPAGPFRNISEIPCPHLDIGQARRRSNGARDPEGRTQAPGICGGRNGVRENPVQHEGERESGVVVRRDSRSRSTSAAALPAAYAAGKPA